MSRAVQSAGDREKTNLALLVVISKASGLFDVPITRQSVLFDPVFDNRPRCYPSSNCG
jgi:hypothetical protein